MVVSEIQQRREIQSLSPNFTEEGVVGSGRGPVCPAGSRAELLRKPAGPARAGMRSNAKSWDFK